jgi:hypothetical protein
MTGCPSYQVILLTGQSDPRRSALSPLQRAFLDQSVPDDAQIPTNFPYDSSSAPYRPTPLTIASIRNSWQYFRSRSPSFRTQYTSRIIGLIERRESTIFLVGSCGLELFNNFSLPSPLIERIRLFAFGPVARRRPDCEHLLVGSRKDWLSRCFFPTPDRWVDCTHMDYLRSPAVRTLWNEFVGHEVGIRRACA